MGTPSETQPVFEHNMTYQEYLAGLAPFDRIAHQTPQAVHQGAPLGLLGDVANWVESPSRPERGFLLGGAGNVARKMSQNERPTWSDNVFAAMDIMPPGADDALKGGLLALGATRGYKYGIPKSAITVMDPRRVRHPGIYDSPDEIARRAAQNVAPENPAMKDLFGVTRDDLYEMNRGRVGNEPPAHVVAARPRGAKVAQQVINPRNTQRVLDTLEAAGKYPELHKGMDSWYEMQPLLDAYKQVSDSPIEDFKRFQAMTGMASPGSDVLTEINRGTGALYLDKQGRFDEFLKHAGKKKKARGRSFPSDLRGIMGHPYHSTAQGKPMSDYLKSGELMLESPKVPLYIQSAGTPETGFQSALPVGDAHFSRGIGLSDVRTSKETGGSISTPELTTVGPWWAQKIAAPLDLNSVQAQARAWGTFAPATGVDTPVGAPKLELISQKIMDAAQAYGISPQEARDRLLRGEIYAPNLGLLGGASLSLQ